MHFHSVGRPGDDDDDIHVHLGQISRASTMEQLPPQDPLDDVFGSTDVEQPETLNVSHPSDMRRLQTDHSTAGYREGVTVAKEKSIQAGFDEGFSLGATIGLAAGQLLGTLEGIAEAVRSQSDHLSKQIQSYLAEARDELSTDKLFSANYWAPDGNWTYEVQPAGGVDVLFSDVARCHPLIQKWSTVADDQVAVWQINRSILNDEGGSRLEYVVDEPTGQPTLRTTSAKPLEW